MILFFISIIEISTTGESMDIIDNLNSEQQAAVKQTEGPVLVLAGAGSGKTKALTHRIAYLVCEKNVSRYNILAVTFTNKAAGEMGERVSRLLTEEQKNKRTEEQKNRRTEEQKNKRTEEVNGQFPTQVQNDKPLVASSYQPEAIKLPWLGTFHSICVRILRREAHNIGFERGFTIYDSSDQKSIIKRVMRELDIDEKNFNPQAVQYFISGAKNELIDEKEYKKYVNSPMERVVADVYVKYQAYLRKANAFDFDDLIMKCVELFQSNSDILERYQNQFKYIMIDEYQDTNQAQYLWVKLLAKKHKNIMVVGDDYQCLPGDSLIDTPYGTKTIKDVKIGDSIIAACGWGRSSEAKVKNISKKKHSGELCEITLKNGNQIKLTPDHKIFAKLQVLPGKYMVYLMYRGGMGYRIGVTQGVRSRKGEIINGMMVRCNQELGEKMWALKTTENFEEALYFEQLFSFKYGIPTSVFLSRARKMIMGQGYIDKLFTEIDTKDRAEKLAHELDLDLNYPHFRPQAVMKNGKGRRYLNMVMFGENRVYKSRSWHAHRICLNTSGSELKAKLSEKFNTRDGQKGTWRVETSRVDYQETTKMCREILEVDEDLEFSERARLTMGENFSLMPAKNLTEGMIVPVLLENGDIGEEEITDISREMYQGWVFDLEVDNLHNFSADGMIVHNCIYGWRGANFRNILNFERDWPGAKVIKLEQNYRSTDTILFAANEVIKQNKNRTDKVLWTELGSGCPITVYQALNEKDEAEFIGLEISSLVKNQKPVPSKSEGSKIKDQSYGSLSEVEFNFNNFAVLYRTNAQSRALEEAFMRMNIPYRVVGGVRFYERKEIKDMIAYLRIILNPTDFESWDRAAAAPSRGLGEKTLAKIRQISNDKLQTPNEISNDEIPKKLLDFLKMMAEIREVANDMDLGDLIQHVAVKSGYKKHLLDGTPEGEGRWENILELSTVASQVQIIPNDDFLDPNEIPNPNNQMEKLLQFLERVALIQDTDNLDKSGNAVTLMTLHSAKGLEFENVFIAGMEEGIFPHSRSLQDAGEMEEERRLCYVGITRAKKRLYLLCTFERNLYGRFQANPESRFISHIPEGLVDRI
jgi:DNA helicase-2/ATP-dependent DNA helicase PcrA